MKPTLLGPIVFRSPFLQICSSFKTARVLMALDRSGKPAARALLLKLEDWDASTQMLCMLVRVLALAYPLLAPQLVFLVVSALGGPAPDARGSNRRLPACVPRLPGVQGRAQHALAHRHDEPCTPPPSRAAVLPARLGRGCSPSTAVGRHEARRGAQVSPMLREKAELLLRQFAFTVMLTDADDSAAAPSSSAGAESRGGPVGSNLFGQPRGLGAALGPRFQEVEMDLRKPAAKIGSVRQAHARAAAHPPRCQLRRFASGGWKECEESHRRNWAEGRGGRPMGEAGWGWWQG